MKHGNKYGLHRVISPKGVLPQPADKIDNNMDEIYDNEILIDVQTLNIDSASFTQIEQQAGGDHEKIAQIMLDIVAKQGKHRNPVTGSGGMLLGTVEKIGDALIGKTDLKVGDKIALYSYGSGSIGELFSGQFNCIPSNHRTVLQPLLSNRIELTWSQYRHWSEQRYRRETSNWQLDDQIEWLGGRFRLQTIQQGKRRYSFETESL